MASRTARVAFRLTWRARAAREPMSELVNISISGERPTTEAAALDRLQAIHRERCGHAPDVVIRAPGRVNLIGEHVDYHGGPVLPAAISLAIYVGASKRDDGTRK